MRQVWWIAAFCGVVAVPNLCPVPCCAQPADPAFDLFAGEADSSLVNPTNDLAWLLTFDLNEEQIEVARIQNLLSPRDSDINPDAPEPNLAEAEQVCLQWLERTSSTDARVLLSAIRYERGDSPAALIELTEVIAQDPSNWKALWIRSQVLFHIGKTAQANADAEAMLKLMPVEEFGSGENLENAMFDFSRWDFDVRGDLSLLVPAVGSHFLVYFALCLRAGRRQRREAEGTLRLVLAVSLFISLLWMLPVLVSALLIYNDIGNVPGLLWWILVEFFAILIVRSTMNPPNLSYVGKEPLPSCDNPEMLARIDDLSKRIGVATPVVRSQRALDGTRDSAAAFVGGLAPHSVVLYDTILAQLRQDEQDAVIGHELGHIADRSIWVYVTVYPLTAVAIVVLSFLGGSYFGFIAGMAMYVGCFRFLSRRHEYDCDRRSALATSPDAMARGLRRIYAKHPFGKPGLMTSLVHSTASHPSLDERVYALSELAASGATGPDQTVTVPFDGNRVALCRKLVRFFAVAWLCLTAFGISGRLLGIAWPLPLIAVHVAAFGPMLLVILAVRRPARIVTARLKGRSRWSSLKTRQRIAVCSLAGGLAIAAATALFPNWYFLVMPGRSPIPAVTTGGSLLMIIGALVFGDILRPRSTRQSKLAVAIVAAFQRNDFQEALKLCEDNRKALKKDRMLRYQEAISFLATRQYKQCIEICEQLHEEFPHFPLPATALATVYLDRGNPERSLELIREVEQDLHKLDPMPALLAARALRQLGQAEEAQVECERALKLAPDDTSVLGVMASLALDRGDREEADRLIDFATSILPAEPLLIVARGERALLDGDWVTLRREHDTLATRLENDRLLSLHSSLTQFQAALTEYTDAEETPPVSE